MLWVNNCKDIVHLQKHLMHNYNYLQLESTVTKQLFIYSSTWPVRETLQPSKLPTGVILKTCIICKSLFPKRLTNRAQVEQDQSSPLTDCSRSGGHLALIIMLCERSRLDGSVCLCRLYLLMPEEDDVRGFPPNREFRCSWDEALVSKTGFCSGIWATWNLSVADNG